MKPTTPASQSTAILRDLRRGHRITPLQALDRYGSFRLGARIYELRGKGVNVQASLIDVGGKRVAQYWLAKEDRA